MPFLADKMKKLTSILTLFVLLVVPVFATTIHIPDDYPTIQAGIDAASDGDTVLVSAGTYVENITFNGKNIAVIGEDRETTIIDGDQAGSVATFNNGESSTAILSGFTLRNGLVEHGNQNPKGGGIYISGATPQLEYLIITENVAEGDNSGSGGGVMVEYSASTTFDHVILTNNSGISGGGIFVDHNSNVILTNCTITQNTADDRGSGISMYNSSATLNNTILWGNDTTNVEQMFINNSSLTITYSDIEGGWEGEGNIDADPLFCNADSNDFTLYDNSPCVGTGENGANMGALGVDCVSVNGCTDPLAINYNPEANFDDGSCEYDETNYSISFDGVDDYIGLPVVNDVFLSGTISTWVNFNSVSFDNEQTGIYSVGNSPLDGSSVSLLGVHAWENNNLRFGIYYNSWKWVDSGISPSVDTWYNVVGSWGADGLKIYVNGELKATNDSYIDGIPGDDNHYIGSGNQSNSVVDGNIDEVSIWNIALTAEQIQSYVSTPPTGNEEGLVGYWKFNAGEGDILYDHSGNQNHGDINGATWVENVYGCTDSLAGNFNPEANWDDGSCEYPDNGDYSLSFDGVDDYVDFGDIGDLDDGSVQLWFIASGIYGGEQLLVKSVSGVHWGLTFFPPGEQGTGIDTYIGNALVLSYSASSGGADYLFFENAITNHWNHVIITRENSSGTISLYVNGSLADQKTNATPGTPISNSNPLYLGTHNTNAGWLDGYADELAIWNDDLNPSEVAELYNSGNGLDASSNSGNYTSSSNLQGYWKFNAGEGETLYDHSGSQNHGIINGATWVEYIYGCTVPCLENYNPEANWDDGSCGEFVGCPENGDYSLSFDGEDDYVLINSSISLTPLNNLSIIAIVNIENTGPISCIISKGNDIASDSPMDYTISTDFTGTINLINAENSGWYQLEGVTGINNNTWYNIAMTYNGNILKSYLNGNFENSSEFQYGGGNPINTNMGDINQTNNPLKLGAYNLLCNGCGYYFQGIMDEIIMYNAEISAEDLNLNYNDGLVPNQNAIIAHYKFNAGEGDILYDHSGNQNHGTINGATWVENIYGCTDSLATNFNPDANWDDGSCTYPDNGNYSLSFDGVDDYIELPDIDLLGNYTLSMNVKPTSYNDYNNFFNKYPAYAFMQSGGTGNIYAHPKAGYDCSTGQSLTLNEWHNVSLVFNSGEMLIYVNGGVIHSCDNMPNSDDNSYNLTIGKAARYDGEYLNGLIDDAAIWSTALSQSDVQQYISGNTPDTDNLVGHWNFNEGTGTTLTDQTSNGNNGTINGAAWSEDVPAGTEYIYGCTDPLAINYNPDANVDDGSCEYPPDDQIHTLDDYVTVNEDSDSIIEVTINDYNIDWSEDSLFIYRSPDHASSTVIDDSLITYVPELNYFGTDTLEYVVTDGEESDTAAVFIAIESVNDEPMAHSLELDLLEDASIEIVLTGEDVETSELSFEISEGPLHGTLSGSPPNVTYTPGADYYGDDSLAFTVNDGEDTSAPASVVLSIASVNDPPVPTTLDVFIVDSLPPFPGQGIPETVVTLSAETGAAMEDDQTLTFYLTSLPSSMTVSETSGGPVIDDSQLPLELSSAIIYLQYANRFVTDSLNYHVQDDGGTENGGQDTSDEAVVNIYLQIAPFFEYQADGPIEGGISKLDDNSIYVTASGDGVYRFNEDGDMQYKLQVNGDVKAVTTIVPIHDDPGHNIYIGSTDNTLYSFYNTNYSGNNFAISNWALPLGGESSASVAVDGDGNVYIGVDNGFFFAYSPDGNNLWGYNVFSPIYCSAAITMHNDLVFVDSEGTFYFYDLDIISGGSAEPVAEFAMGSGVVSSIAVDEIYLYITTLSGTLVKLEYDPIFISDPDLQWIFTADTEITSSPIIGSNHEIYFGTNNGTMYSIDSETGNMIWSYDTGAPVNSTGALAEYGTDMDRLYIGNDDGDVYALSLSDGTPSWIYNSGSGVVSSFLYDSGVVYFGTVDGGILRVADTEPMMAAAQRDDVREITPIWSTFQGNNIRTGMQESAEISLNINYYSGWNMVGLPVLVDDAHYQTLFPEAASGSLYSYGGSYNAETDLVPGTGYWLRLVTGGVVEFMGSSIDELNVSVTEGWNLISGLSTPVDVAVLYSSGLVVTGGIYGYDGSYVSPDMIHPGMGYWLRATQDGEITMSATAIATKTLAQVNHLEGSNTLELSNGTHSSTLYFGKDVAEEHRNSYSLPPTFPQMAFDVRFNGDMKYAFESGDIEVLNTSDNLIISYDVIIDAGEHMNWVLTSESGKEYTLEGTGEITIPTEETFTLERKEIIPIAYTLHQNYPNPFNPITSLRYDLPEQAQVTLTVYDLMGREVTKLVNTTQEAGYRSVQWNATNMHGKPVSAGVYLYQVRAGEFVQTRKMVLLK